MKIFICPKESYTLREGNISFVMRRWRLAAVNVIKAILALLFLVPLYLWAMAPWRK